MWKVFSKTFQSIPKPISPEHRLKTLMVTSTTKVMRARSQISILQKYISKFIFWSNLVEVHLLCKCWNFWETFLSQKALLYTNSPIHAKVKFSDKKHLIKDFAEFFIGISCICWNRLKPEVLMVIAKKKKQVERKYSLIIQQFGSI